MARRKLVAGLLLAAGSLGGAIAYRRFFSRRRARVDLYFDDGSMVTRAEGSEHAARLLALADDVLHAARAI